MTKKAAAASGTKKRSQAQEVWLRLKKNKQAMVGLAVFLPDRAHMLFSPTVHGL